MKNQGDVEVLSYEAARHFRNKDENKSISDDAVVSILKEVLADALWFEGYSSFRVVGCKKPLVKARIKQRDGWSYLTLEGRGKMKGKFHMHYGITSEGMTEYEIHRNIYYGLIRDLLSSHIQRGIEDVRNKEKEDKP